MDVEVFLHKSDLVNVGAGLWCSGRVLSPTQARSVPGNDIGVWTAGLGIPEAL